MFESEFLEARNGEIVAEVEQASRRDGSEVVVDTTARSMTDMVAVYRRLQQQQPQQPQQQQQPLTVLSTSKELVRDYDREHPERIACMAFSLERPGVQFFVFANNRQYDVGGAARAWTGCAGPTSASDCTVCLDALLKKNSRRPRKTTVPFWMCTFCQNPVCTKCLGRFAHEDAVQCPTCRQWTLSGVGFGVPRSLLPALPTCPQAAPSASASASASDALVALMCGLDGAVRVVPRWGAGFMLDLDVVLNRMTGSNRFVGDARPRAVRRQLARLLAALPALTFHVFRKTFDIDAAANRPVVERSVLCAAGGPTAPLLQLPNDAWIDVFEPEQPFVHRCVEYLPPTDFAERLPEHVRRLFFEELAHARFACATVFFSVPLRLRPRSEFGGQRLFDASYDTDADGRPGTMPASAICVLLYQMLAIAAADGSAVDVHVIGGTPGKPDLFRASVSPVPPDAL